MAEEYEHVDQGVQDHGETSTEHTEWRYDEHVDQRVQDHGETSTAVQGGDMMNMSIKGYRTMARPALLYRVEI